MLRTSVNPGGPIFPDSNRRRYARPFIVYKKCDFWVGSVLGHIVFVAFFDGNRWNMVFPDRSVELD